MTKETDLANENFWDEPCGESHFKSLGFESLSQFDDWFFNFQYPYLSKLIPFDSFAGKKILEVGLGYGSVSQRIMESGASFFGLDLAKGPVRLVRERLKEKYFLERWFREVLWIVLGAILLSTGWFPSVVFIIREIW